MSDNHSASPLPETTTPPTSPGGRTLIFGRPISLGFLLAWIAVLGFLVLLAFGLIRSQQGHAAVGQKAPNFTLTTFEGQPIKLSDHRGKVVLVNFWASWCKPCEAEAAYLQSAWEYYQPQNDVLFLGVDYVDTEPEAKAYLEKFHITYPNGPDLGTRISQRYRMSGVPETYVIGPDGKLAWTEIGGFTSVDQIKSIIEPLRQQNN